MRVNAAALVAALALATPVAAGPATGEEHRAAGYAHAERGEWDEAIRAYELAFAIDRDPVALYAIGRIWVQRGDCTQARAAFERFLATAPPPKARASAEGEIERCQPTVAVPAHADETVDDATAEIERPAAPAFYRDALGGALVGTGVVAGGLGGYFYLHARSTLCTDPCTGSYEAYQDSVARARSWRTGAVIAGGVGGALVVGGIIRWVAVSHRHAPADVAVSWAPHPGGGALVLGGSF